MAARCTKGCIFIAIIIVVCSGEVSTHEICPETENPFFGEPIKIADEKLVNGIDSIPSNPVKLMLMVPEDVACGLNHNEIIENKLSLDCHYLIHHDHHHDNDKEWSCGIGKHCRNYRKGFFERTRLVFKHNLAEAIKAAAIIFFNDHLHQKKIMFGETSINSLTGLEATNLLVKKKLRVYSINSMKAVGMRKPIGISPDGLGNTLSEALRVYFILGKTSDPTGRTKSCVTYDATCFVSAEERCMKYMKTYLRSKNDWPDDWALMNLFEKAGAMIYRILGRGDGKFRIPMNGECFGNPEESDDDNSDSSEFELLGEELETTAGEVRSSRTKTTHAEGSLSIHYKSIWTDMGPVWGIINIPT